MNMSSESTQFAHSIIQQLGGLGKLEAMVAARNFVCDPQDQHLRFRFKGNRRINCIQIRLNPLDLYDLVFYKIPGEKGMMRGDELKEVYCCENVDAEKLVEIFEETTGLKLSLF